MSLPKVSRIPSLSRLPKEIGREVRECEACGEVVEHIVYLVPKKVVLLYVKDHRENVHATCVSCASSTVLYGEERDRALARSRGREAGTG
jgi:hypothetical protein